MDFTVAEETTTVDVEMAEEPSPFPDPPNTEVINPDPWCDEQACTIAVVDSRGQIVSQTFDRNCLQSRNLHLLGLLGNGSFSTAYLSCVDETGCDFVTKISNSMRPDEITMSNRAGERGYGPVIREYFACNSREGTAWTFLVMQKMSGTFKQWLDLGNVFTVDHARTLIQLLSDFFAEGFQHNDMKVDNLMVLIDHTGNVSFKIIDFGYCYYQPFHGRYVRNDYNGWPRFVPFRPEPLWDLGCLLFSMTHHTDTYNPMNEAGFMELARHVAPMFTFDQSMFDQYWSLNLVALDGRPASYIFPSPVL